VGAALQVSQNEIRQALESNDEDAKVEAMQKAITAILAGEQFPALFITIVRYVLPSENHMVQKLLLLYLVSGGGQGQAGAGRRRCCVIAWERAQCRALPLHGWGRGSEGSTCRLCRAASAVCNPVSLLALHLMAPGAPCAEFVCSVFKA